MRNNDAMRGLGILPLDRPAHIAAALGPDDYVEWRGTQVGAITERLERRLILAMAGDVDGCRVLDLGCGDGELALELWRRGARVVGVDASASMIEAARAKAKGHRADISFFPARAERLPFAGADFDLVLAVTILCFVDDAAPVFREIARVLRPSGQLVIGELGKWSTWAVGRRLRAWLGSSLWRHGKFRMARELAALARSAGLEPGPIRGAVYYPRWGRAARVLAPHDATLGRLTTLGAAFVALRATKPAALDHD